VPRPRSPTHVEVARTLIRRFPGLREKTSLTELQRGKPSSRMRRRQHYWSRCMTAIACGLRAVEAPGDHLASSTYEN
jgi:hypothetical protein